MNPLLVQAIQAAGFNYDGVKGYVQDAIDNGVSTAAIATILSGAGGDVNNLASQLGSAVNVAQQTRDAYEATLKNKSATPGPTLQDQQEALRRGSVTVPTAGITPVAVNNQTPNGGGGGSNASILAQQINKLTGWSYQESVDLAAGIIAGDAGAIALGVRIGVIPNVNTNGAGAGSSNGPSEGDKLRLALANFDPTRDLVKLGTGNKWFNKITGETIDLTNSDPTQFKMVTAPDGTPTGYMVNDKGQSIDIGAGKLAQAVQDETVRANKAREDNANKGLDISGRQVDIASRNADETARSNAANEAETKRKNDIEQANTIANMQANPGKWVQREYTIANMMRPSGINEPGTYTGLGSPGYVAPDSNPNLANDQAKGALAAAEYDRIHPTIPNNAVPTTSGPISLTLGGTDNSRFTYTPPPEVSQLTLGGTDNSRFTYDPNRDYNEYSSMSSNEVASSGDPYASVQDSFDRGYAEGTPNGMVNDRQMIIGDQQAEQQGLPGANPELVSNPTGAPIGVQPLQDMPPEQQSAVMGNMGPATATATSGSPKVEASPTKIISQVMALLDKLPGDSGEIAHDVGRLLMDRLHKDKIDSAVSNMQSPSNSGPIALAYGTRRLNRNKQANDDGEFVGTDWEQHLGFKRDNYLDEGFVDTKPYTGNYEGQEPSNEDGMYNRNTPKKYADGTGYSYGGIQPIAVNNTTSPLLSSLTTTPPIDTQNLPSLDYLRGGDRRTGPASKETGAAFGTSIPEFTGINYGRYLDLRQDPATFGLLSSLYASASRDLVGEASRAKQLAPIGSAVRRIRT